MIKNKQKLIDFLRTDIQLHEDNWHNFKTEDNVKRYNISKTSVRYETKVSTKWIRIWSAYYKDIAFEDGKIKVIKTIK